MNGYVTRKESICLFETDGGEQRGKSFVRRRKHTESGKTACDVLALLVREFGGEVISGDKMTLYPLEY
jgi:hypothetical protein